MIDRTHPELAKWQASTVKTLKKVFRGSVLSLQWLCTNKHAKKFHLLRHPSLLQNCHCNANFIFFSSAEQRVKNFYAKVTEIESLKTNISTYTALTASRPNLISDLNSNLDVSFKKIITELKDIIKKDKINFNDIIHAIQLISPDIKLKPIELIQFVMITIQKNVSNFMANVP